jgi:simple sugar transport system permease protein
MIKKTLKTYQMPIFFLCMSILGLMASGLSPSFVINETINRFIRNGVMVFALIIPIKAGMGLNFSVTVGAMCAQIGYITVLGLGLMSSGSGFLALVIGLMCACLIGYLIGLALNRVPGKEMITTIIIGFLASGIYQLIFLVSVGSIIPIRNKDIVLSRGIGIRNLIDLEPFRQTLDKLLVVEVFGVSLPLFMIGFVLIFGAFIYYVMHTPFGIKVKCVGESGEKAHMVGIEPDVIRIKAMVLSTVIACIGHFLYLQNIGMLNVYTGHLKHEIFASAALMAGGATIKNATVRQGIIGLLVFHALFIVSPQAGQNLFNNPALGEYFRSFVAYGTIALALVTNFKNSGEIDT